MVSTKLEICAVVVLTENDKRKRKAETDKGCVLSHAVGLLLSCVG